MTSDNDLDLFDQLKEKVRPHRLEDGPLRFVLLNNLIADLSGNVVELGTGEGRTTRLIANNIGDRKLYTFDWFNGNPEDWRKGFAKGFGSQQGGAPTGLPKNVTVYRGLFVDTIPKFVKEHKKDVALLFVDSDLYSSAKVALTGLASRLRKGSIVVFDEFFGYDEWKEGEAKAFIEFLKEEKKKYVVIGIRGDPDSRKDFRQQKVAFRIYDENENINGAISVSRTPLANVQSTIESTKPGEEESISENKESQSSLTVVPVRTSSNLSLSSVNDILSEFKVQLIVTYGRPEYFKCLLSYIVRDLDLFDGVWIWENTKNKNDVHFMQDRITEVGSPKIVIKHPSNPTGNRHGVYPLYNLCKDDKTLYIKIDDDIVFVAPGAFEALIKFALAKRNSNSVISANVINSGPLDAKHQEMGASRQQPIIFDSQNPYKKLMTAEGADQVHQSFQDAVLNGNVERYYTDHTYLNGERWSINCIAFLGSLFNDRDRSEMLKDDEKYICKKLGITKGKYPAVCPQAVMSHYSFIKQRTVTTGLLKKKKASGFDEDLSILTRYQKWAEEV